MKRRTRAFTIIELLVVVSIIALLVGILLPAIGKARDQAKVTISQANLKQLGTAHASYAAEWNDRQFTLIDDNIASYGTTAGAAFPGYQGANGGGPAGAHPPLALGWGYDRIGNYGYWHYPMTWPGNHSLVQPIAFAGYFGAFRIPNARQFNQYVSGRFYDPVWYAPKDSIAWEVVERAGCFEDPGEFSNCVPEVAGLGDLPAWSSYCLSPAAMFNPDVMSHRTASGEVPWRRPWEMPAGFRSPPMGHASFPSLKTHMLEHHWLQNRRAECNPAFNQSVFNNCEPYYFNHAWDSSPISLFYDGHVESIGTRAAQRHHQRVEVQTGNSGGGGGSESYGLWHERTAYGMNGYLIDDGYEVNCAVSHHILTVDGIKGRDILSD
jgi:prepilin-type N-terminal cleavage/methylation domain-containing protein